MASKVCAAATRQRPRTRRALNATFARAAAKNGVVIATEKKLPSVLIDETSMQKILTLTNNIFPIFFYGNFYFFINRLAICF